MVWGLFFKTKKLDFAAAVQHNAHTLRTLNQSPARRVFPVFPGDLRRQRHSHHQVTSNTNTWDGTFKPRLLVTLNVAAATLTESGIPGDISPHCR